MFFLFILLIVNIAIVVLNVFNWKKMIKCGNVILNFAFSYLKNILKNIKIYLFKKSSNVYIQLFIQKQINRAFTIITLVNWCFC